MRRIVPIVAVAAGFAIASVLFTLSRPPEEPLATPAAEDAFEPRRDREAPGAFVPAPARPAPAPPAPRNPAPARRPAAVDPPAPELGTLRIDADVAGAQVFIDRRFIGTTPVTAENLTPGTHQLNVSAPGFDGVSQPIQVEPGTRDLAISLREIRLDARLQVVHRHRIGSCAGELTATPDGIRYATSNTEDAFSVPLTGLEGFEVDYLEKNLRIRLRGGTTYNFTDPEGNADRLFVFHRDVERARQQLAARAGER